MAEKTFEAGDLREVEPDRVDHDPQRIEDTNALSTGVLNGLFYSFEEADKDYDCSWWSC